VELDRLRRREQLDRKRALGVREHLPQLQSGGVPHRDVILLTGARRDRIDRRGVAERLVLGDERRRDVLRDHEAAVQAAVRREEGGQAVRQIRVDEPFDPSLGDAREFGDRHRRRVERERERLAVEVAVRDELALVDEHERIVGRGVELDADRVRRVVEEVARGAVHLRRTAQRVRVLHLVAPAVRFDDRRAVEEPEDIRGRSDLAAQRPKRVDLGEERGARPVQRLDRESACDVRSAREPPGADEAEREHRRHELRPVDEREPFLRGEADRLEAGACKRRGAGKSLAADPRLALADERQCEMRERREVARGADRAARRHDRQHTALEQREEQLNRLDPRPGVALRERIRPEEQRRPDHLVGIRRAHAARVRAEEPQLELLGLLLGNCDRDETAEAGVDAVRVLTRAVGDALDELPRGAHLLPCRIGQLGAHPVDSDRPDVVDRQILAGHTDRACHAASLRCEAVTTRKSSYRSLASLERDLSRCRACVEAGYPLESLSVHAPGAGQLAYLFGQAPGIVEGNERLPWRGRAGRTLRRWLELDEDEFYTRFYCASVTRCYPGRAASGRGDRTPTPREQELCSFWREWEIELLRPRLVVTVGGVALKRLLGVTTLTPHVGEKLDLGGTPVVPLPHPSGASGWLNDPANRERLDRAAALVRSELRRVYSQR
jgi:uracil-DNA glycosylase